MVDRLTCCRGRKVSASKTPLLSFEGIGPGSVTLSETIFELIKRPAGPIAQLV